MNRPTQWQTASDFEDSPEGRQEAIEYFGGVAFEWRDAWAEDNGRPATELDATWQDIHEKRLAMGEHPTQRGVYG